MVKIGIKILFSLLILALGAAASYGVVYYWVYHDVGSSLNANVLKGQLTANQDAGQVQQQLKDLGFSFQSGDFHALNTASSTSYKSSVLNGFEPQKQDQPKDKAFYFYDTSGAAYYVNVKDDNTVDPTSIVPLISE